MSFLFLFSLPRCFRTCTQWVCKWCTIKWCTISEWKGWLKSLVLMWKAHLVILYYMFILVCTFLWSSGIIWMATRWSHGPAFEEQIAQKLLHCLYGNVTIKKSLAQKHYRIKKKLRMGPSSSTDYSSLPNLSHTLLSASIEVSTLYLHQACVSTVF